MLHRRTLGERVTAALVRFASKSDEGIGDERVPISILTCQIRWPLPDFGSPPAYFPSGSGRGVSLVFFRGSWHRKLWGNRPLSFAPSMRSWWRWSLVPWPCWVSTGPAERFIEPQRGKLEERFLRFKMSPSHRSLPFPPICTLRCRGLGENLSRPASSSLPQITMVMWGGTREGYRAMPRVEQTLASYLSSDLASSLKSPTLPTKPLRASSALVGKRYVATGKAGSCLHTMAVLQAYQADLLKELDEGEGFNAKDISELRKTADLSLRATKETARAIRWSMAALMAAERHLWLTLLDIKDRDRVFLLAALLLPSGLFGDAVDSVVDKHQEVRRQAASFQWFLPHRSLAHGAAGREQPLPHASSSHREAL